MEESTKETELTVEKTPTAEELLALSAKEKIERANACSDEVNAIIKKYNCNLAISGFVITAN